LGTSVSNLCSLAAKTVYIGVIKPVGDIIFNEILARAEGYIRGNKHGLSQKNYDLSTKSDQIYVSGGAVLNSFGNRAAQYVAGGNLETSENIESLLSRYLKDEEQQKPEAVGG